MKKLAVKNERGFTLLEVLAVIAVIGLMASFITPRIAQSVQDARGNACEANIKYLEGILERAAMDDEGGKYPQGVENVLKSDSDAISDYTSEFPVCPHEDLDNGKTGYYYNQETGKVYRGADSGGDIEFENATN